MSNYDNTNSGVLFQNDKKGNEKAPDYKGKLNVNGKDYELAGWLRDGKTGKFLSVKIQEPKQKTETSEKQEAKNSDLPF
jgi:uncharacterized protein (DUF736 family)